MKSRKWISILILGACSFSPATPVSPVVPPSSSGVINLSDYPDMQAAVNALPQGGTVLVNSGVYEIGNVVINQANEWRKVVTIQGVSPGYLGQSPPLGNSQWDYLLNHGYSYGTVLRGRFDVTTKGATLFLRDLSMIGYGEGIAVDIGNGSDMFADAGGIYRVSFGNYETAIRIRKSYFVPIADVFIAGVNTGIQILDSNVIQMTGVDLMSCQLGADLQGVSISFENGSVEGCANGVRMQTLTGSLGNVYFEQILGLSLEITGNGNSITSNFYASNSGTVRISGKNNDITLGLNPNLPIDLTSTSSYNYVRGSAYLVCSDAGFKNRCEKLWP